MMTDDTMGSSPAFPVVSPDRKVEHVLSANAPVIYANNVEVRTSLFDTMIQLGLIEEATPETLVVKELGRVILSPPHMKALAEILSRNVTEYERTFGPIPTGPRLDELEQDRVRSR